MNSSTATASPRVIERINKINEMHGTSYSIRMVKAIPEYKAPEGLQPWPEISRSDIYVGKKMMFSIKKMQRHSKNHVFGLTTGKFHIALSYKRNVWHIKIPIFHKSGWQDLYFINGLSQEPYTRKQLNDMLTITEKTLREGNQNND